VKLLDSSAQLFALPPAQAEVAHNWYSVILRTANQAATMELLLRLNNELSLLVSLVIPWRSFLISEYIAWWWGLEPRTFGARNRGLQAFPLMLDQPLNWMPDYSRYCLIRSLQRY